LARRTGGILRAMSGITLAAAQARLQLYLDAEAAVLAGQRYEIAGRMLQRADLAEIRKGIEHWNAQVSTLSARSSGRGRVAIPRPGW
jgi:hypothetical protein